MESFFTSVVSHPALQSTIGPLLSDESIGRFNNVLLEFLTKFKRVAKLEGKDAEKVDRILSLANANSPLTKTLFATVLNDNVKEQIDDEDTSLFAEFPFLPLGNFENLSNKTKKSVWKYLKKLVRIAENNTKQSNAIEELTSKLPSFIASVNWENFGDELYIVLGKVKKVIIKHGITQKNLSPFVKDLLETIPPLGEVKASTYEKQIVNFISNVLFVDDVQ